MGYELARAFIGNHPREDRPFLEQAAQEMGYKISIQEEATDVHGHLISNCIAVYTAEPGREHGPFWRRFRELKEPTPCGPFVE